MFKTIAKWCAKIALNYLDTVAVWALRYGADKTKDNLKAQRIIVALEGVSEDATLIAKSMKDGVISAEEETIVKTRVKALAEELKALL
jgi:hypothetical protein